jgi:hypothetical protein
MLSCHVRVKIILIIRLAYKRAITNSRKVYLFASIQGIGPPEILSRNSKPLRRSIPISLGAFRSASPLDKLLINRTFLVTLCIRSADHVPFKFMHIFIEKLYGAPISHYLKLFFCGHQLRWQ